MSDHDIDDADPEDGSGSGGFPVSRSDALTDGVRVEVRARYSPEHSDPTGGRWFFLYTIRITNEGDNTCQLISRHWIITDATGQVKEVQGPGVVGE